MESETRGKRRNGVALVVALTIVVVVMLIASSVVDRLAPPGEPLYYLVGTGIVVGILAGTAVAAISRRHR